jgi:ketosteroid isomerase-like protein
MNFSKGVIGAILLKTICMRTALLFLLLCISLMASAQKSEETKILELLAAQTKAWNRGDVEGFMQTYWKSDSLMFIGKNGVTRGWQQTLDNYKKGYPDTTAMGKLSFDIIKVEQLSPQSFFVVGKWMLKRTIGDLSGHYTLLLRKIKGQWVIVADHSS